MGCKHCTARLRTGRAGGKRRHYQENFTEWAGAKVLVPQDAPSPWAQPSSAPGRLSSSAEAGGLPGPSSPAGRRGSQPLSRPRRAALRPKPLGITTEDTTPIGSTRRRICLFLLAWKPSTVPAQKQVARTCSSGAWLKKHVHVVAFSCLPSFFSPAGLL